MNFLRDLTMAQIMAALAAYLIYAALQGGLLAGLARLMGETRPRNDHRLNLNPFSHLAMLGLFMAVLFKVGWIRPLRFENPTNGSARLRLVGIAILGLGGMLVLIPLLDLVRPALLAALPQTGGYAALLVVQQVQRIILASTALNALPLPGLVGGIFLQALWPGSTRRIIRLEPFVFALIIVLLVLGWMPNPENLLSQR